MRPSVPIVFGTAAATGFALVLVIHRDWLHPFPVKPDVFTFYSEKLRPSFFAGFLTIGGFMLSLKTFVLLKMKEGLYDSPEYRQLHADMTAFSCKTRSLYAPLRELSHLLFYSILAALITSASQLTIGLWASWWSAALCIGFAAGTLALLIFSLIQIRKNLDAWFNCLDKAAKTKKPAKSAETG